MNTENESKNLALIHKFTDRGGAEVYDAFADADRLEMQTVLFEIRINNHPSDPPVITRPATGKVCGHGTG